MKCIDTKNNSSAYLDDLLDNVEISQIESHLEVCPNCRSDVTELKGLRNELRLIGKPAMPAATHDRVRSAVRFELRHGRPGIGTAISELLGARILQFGVGVAASVLIGFSFLSLMFDSGRYQAVSGAAPQPIDTSDMVASNKYPFAIDRKIDIVPSDYARNRVEVANESPSINPQGALVALTRSMVRGNIKEDSVVVVADVFSNGLAQIAEVIDPSRNKDAVEELERALDGDLGNAPFVPAAMDNRSDSVRVVLRFETVDVKTTRQKKRP